VKRSRVEVVGAVQGVFFRVECARRARELGVAGSVANRPDGTVEAVFEGPDAAVDAMIGWCGRGPAGARVDEVRVQDEAPSGTDGFVILQ
jgi:acylphosphatase